MTSSTYYQVSRMSFGKFYSGDTSCRVQRGKWLFACQIILNFSCISLTSQFFGCNSTCYFNVLIHMLFYNLLVRDAVFNIPLGHSDHRDMISTCYFRNTATVFFLVVGLQLVATLILVCSSYFLAGRGYRIPPTNYCESRQSVHD